MKFIKITLLLMLFIIENISAQTPEFPNALGSRVFIMDYHQIAQREEFSFAYELSYHRNLMENFNIVLPARIGVINYPDVSNNATFFSIDVLGQYVFNKADKKFAPFIQAGFGPVVIFNDYETDFSIPVGVGFDYNVSKRGSFNMLLEYRLSFPSANNGVYIGVGGKYIIRKISMDTISEVIPDLPKDMDGDGIVDSEDTCPEVAGIIEFFGCPDTDGDGIKDSEDKCPDVAGVMAFMGCPDTDGDGISDLDDKCPNEVGSLENEGCPKVVLDKDGDGIVDEEDKCPEMPGTAKYFGCPVVDTDKDGIPDDIDDCPELYGMEKFNGCPDRDNDGVSELDDKCPTTYGPASNNGCPEISIEDKAVLDFALNNIQFKTGKASLKTASFKILDQVVTIMNNYPDYYLKINGHTDNVGDDDRNMDLSSNRAKSCMVYLVENGIEAYRISHEGFGETMPIADNKRTAGRAKNRRVEFDLYLK